MPKHYHKLFGVGLSKTGTTSLTIALNILGIRSIHYPPLPQLHELMKKYVGATDTPVGAYFRELDHLYPGSKFILTVRDKESWIRSATMEFEKVRPLASWQREVRRRAYGSVEWIPSLWASAFERHARTVAEYFCHRTDDLLEMNIVAGEGWKPLCKFLKLPAPDVPFPWKNKTPY